MNGLLFDLDGVLVDVSKSYDLTVSSVVERFAGRSVSGDEIQSFRSRGGLNNDWDLAEAMVKEYGGRVDRWSLVALFQEIYLGRNFDGLILKETPLIDVRVLRELQKKFKLAIVTGRPRDEAVFALDRFAMREAFSALVTMDDLPPGRGKPDPLGIRLALAALDVNSAVYVGDTVDDMDAARGAGISAVAVVRDPRGKEDHIRRLRSRGASVVLGDVNDILEVV